MTHAHLDDLRRADQRARLGPPGMLHLNAARLGEVEDLTFGAA